MSPLDRPVWSALHGAQAHLAVASGDAVRIDPAYGPFAAAARGAEDALAAALRGPDDEIWLIETEAVAAPPGCRVVRVAPLVQLVSQGLVPALGHDDIEPLGEGDAAEMAALALANQPGPWGPATHHYGAFYGIRRDGALVAMAGERMRPAPGLAEVSGVPAPKRKVPWAVAMAAAYANEAFSAVTGIPPKAPLAGVRMSGYKMWFSPAKAIRELGLPQTPPRQAFADAAAWFRDNGYVRG